MKRSAVGKAALVAGCACLASCHRPAPPAPQARLHFVAPAPWQGANGAWFYPQARYGGSFSGYAVALDPDQAFATDGSANDPVVPAASVQSLQLPVVLRVTDLLNGRQISVRADNRGPDDPGRVLGLNRAARQLLGIADNAAPVPVSVTIEADTSQAIADALGGLPHVAFIRRW